MSHAKLGITKDLLATKVLPFLIPISIDSSLNLSQVNFLSSYVESDVIYYFKKNNMYISKRFLLKSLFFLQCFITLNTLKTQKSLYCEYFDFKEYHYVYQYSKWLLLFNRHLS